MMIKPVDLNQWQERPLSVHQVAALLDIHPSSVYRKAQNGELPSPKRMAGLTRWLGSEIAVLLGSHAQPHNENPTE